MKLSRQQRLIVETLRRREGHMRILNDIAFNYTARISELRQKGFVILKHCLGGSEFEYELAQEPHEQEVGSEKPEGDPAGDRAHGGSQRDVSAPRGETPVVAPEAGPAGRPALAETEAGPAGPGTPGSGLAA